MRVLVVLALTVSVAGSCRSRSPATGGAGTISVDWTGKLRGSFTASAVARWCAADTLLEVIAVRNDTAVGLSLIARDSVRAEAYVMNETSDYAPVRPYAGLALRFLNNTNLYGFESLGGQVTLTQGGTVISGTIEGVRLRPVSSTDTLRLKGSFDRIPIVPAEGLCGRANRPGGG
jgi:hypothetical protein